MAQQPWDGDILPPAPAWKGKSERLVVREGDPWITPSERAGLTATPGYDETVDFLRRMDEASPLIRMESFGKSAQGRDLLAVFVSRDGERFDPAKPVLLFQAGIHSGEIDGKDAGLMLLRDIAFKGKDRLLDRVNLVFVPMFNPDGHERTSPYSRPNQRGPVSQGWRTTAQNLNLNRDYAKADAPEMRAMIGLIRRVKPDLYLDLHVTDGIDYQYDITFGYAAYEGRYARSPEIGKWLEGAYDRTVTAGLKAAGHIPGPLIFAVDDRNLAAGLGATASTPRFSTGYGDAIGLATVLVENHSLKPYRQRVLGTYVLIENSIKALAEHGAELRAATAADHARRDAQTVSWLQPTAPEGTRAFLPIGYSNYQSPASGRQEVRWDGKPGKPIQLPVFYSRPGARVERPAAYWVPATKPAVIELLRLHGVEMEITTAPRTVEVEMIRLKDAKPASNASESRVRINAAVAGRERRREVYPAGSARVPTDQPLGTFAMLLLEPESDETLVGWGFFNEIFQRTEYIEGYAIAPMAERMLAADPALKAEFEARLAADPAFAADADARLQWFYERTPFFDGRWNLYPVGRELR